MYVQLADVALDGCRDGGDTGTAREGAAWAALTSVP
jgi:hypothetical protein